MLSSVCRLASAPSTDLTISVRQTFNSLALLNARASIPGISIPPAPALRSVFEVEEVRFLRLLIIVVLGVVVMDLLIVLESLVSKMRMGKAYLLQPIFMQRNGDAYRSTNRPIDQTVVDAVAQIISL